MDASPGNIVARTTSLVADSNSCLKTSNLAGGSVPTAACHCRSASRWALDPAFILLRALATRDDASGAPNLWASLRATGAVPPSSPVVSAAAAICAATPSAPWRVASLALEPLAAHSGGSFRWGGDSRPVGPHGGSCGFNHLAGVALGPPGAGTAPDHCPRGP